MRVGFDARGLCGHRTGVGTYAANLIEALLEVDPGTSVLLVSNEKLPPFPWLSDERVSVVERPGAAWNNFVWTNLSLRREIARGRVDVFHSPSYTRPLRLGVPSIVTLHDVCYEAARQWYPYSSSLWRRRWYRASAVGADAILTVSEFSRREIMKVYGVPPEKIRLIYPGVDRRRFHRIETAEPVAALRARYGLPKELVLFVGDVHPRRNVGKIIEALSEVKACLVVIGRVMEQPAKAAPPDVRYLGYVPDSDLPLFYNAAQALVYPSFYEGFGFPILEAMACGCPVIVSRGTACEETAGDAGLKVNPASVGAIAEAMKALLGNCDLARRCAEAGLARAAQFDWRRTVEKTRQVYLDFTAPPRTSSRRG